MVEIAVNSKVLNKTNDFRTYNCKFENKKLAARELLNHILQGHAFCIAKLKNSGSKYCVRNTENFEHGQLIAIDIDNKDGNKRLTIEEGYRTFDQISNDSHLAQIGSFVYTTPSHTNNHHRFRIVFLLDEPITNKNEFKLYLTELTKIYGGDLATTSIVQGFFGSKDAKYTYFGNTLQRENFINLIPKKEESFKELLKNEIIEQYDYHDFNKQDYINILQAIFKNGKISNDIWWRIPTILKSYCKLPHSTILELISSTIGEIGDTENKLKYSDKYIGKMHLGHLVKLAQLNGYVKPIKEKVESKIFKFWTIHNSNHPNSKSKLSVDIKYTLFEDFIVKNGFLVYRNDKANILVRTNTLNHIRIVQESELREFVFTTLKMNGFLYSSQIEKQLVNEKLRRLSDRIFGTTIRNLPLINKSLR